MPDPIACVLGGIEIVRPLALAGVRSAVVAAPGDPARFSRHVSKVIDWIDPSQEPAALLERLLEFAATEPERPVLYYDGDCDLLFVSRHRAQLGEAFRFVVAAPDLVEDLVDKSRFQLLSERLALPVPAGRLLLAADERSLDLDVGFPAIVKPLTRRQTTWKRLVSAKAARVDTPAELHALRLRLTGAGVDVLVQELVPGPESMIESYHVYADERGEIVGEFAGRKLRTYPAGYGYTTALELTDRADVLDLGRDLVERLRLQGVAKFDFKRTEDGDLVLLEVNPRFNLWHHPGARAGVNLPDLVYRDLVGLPRPPARRARPGVSWCSLPNDLFAARDERIGLARWLAWVLRCEAISAFAWTDPLPLVRGALWRLRMRVRRLRRARPAAAGGAGS